MATNEELIKMVNNIYYKLDLKSKLMLLILQDRGAL